MPSFISFDKNVCTNLSQASEKEWLETNGIGGYASSTITGANTRRYHGLLMAATKPPLGRILTLSKLEESLSVGEDQFPLSTNFYPNAIYPEGYKNLVQFDLTPVPTFTYSIHGITIEKSVFMVYGENTTVIRYRISASGAASAAPLFLKARVLIAFRDDHWLTHENQALNTHYEPMPHGVCLRPYEGLPPLYLFHNAQSMDKDFFWYKNMEYPKEIERGLEANEDHFSPFALNFDVSGGADFFVVASLHPHSTVDASALFNGEIKRRAGLRLPPPAQSPIAGSSATLNHSGEKVFGVPVSCSEVAVEKTVHKGESKENKHTEALDALLFAAHSFIVKRGSNKKSMIAGYPWFGDWGRDTMISLPGLTLVQGRFDDAREILLTFAQFVDKGMIPNRFPDYGETPEYNTVDASLWYINAVYQYLRFAKDLKTIRTDLYGVMKEIVEWYKKGTRYNIGMDSDGLIYAGVEGIQLTWMDAKVCDWVVTPRIGKAVEINALWYNALKIMAFFAREMGLLSELAGYNALSQKVEKSFLDAFWFPDGQYLFDYIHDNVKDAAIRPNQIFAVSLTYSMLPLKKQRSVVDVVEKHLLTPYGLRSLSPHDKDYIGRYYGNQYERDRAYHQGTVWAWLIGPYLSAYTQAYAGAEGACAYIEGLFKPFYGHLLDAGVGTVSEIFDGDAPHTPRGCIAQAWSVGEIVRAYFEHLYGFENC